MVKGQWLRCHGLIFIWSGVKGQESRVTMLWVMGHGHDQGSEFKGQALGFRIGARVKGQRKKVKSEEGQNTPSGRSNWKKFRTLSPEECPTRRRSELKPVLLALFSIALHIITILFFSYLPKMSTTILCP